MNGLLTINLIVFIFLPINYAGFCDPIPLNKISINAHCEYRGIPISCKRPIPPMTLVRISCKIGYEKPATFSDIILCNDFGEWNVPPWQCEQICGTPLREFSENILLENKVVTNIRNVPWHVAVYYHYGEQYSYLCGGSIISSRIVLSAAHCFWDGINSEIGETSKYAIAAGKTLNDINAVEETVPQFFNITEIITKEQYLSEEGLYNNDIAIIILSEYIIFTEYILPVCVDLNLSNSQTDIAAGKLGKLSGWGMTESGGSPSDILMTIELPSVDYLTCRANSNISFRKYITSDKFCAGFLDGASSCQGDSGGGLVFIKRVNYMDKYYVYGIVSLGPSHLGSCDITKYSLFTNVNYHINFIKLYMDQYLHNETIFTRPQYRSCNTPVIPKNGKIVYAHDKKHELIVGEVIPNYFAIEYKCYNNFILIGVDGDTCINGEWSRPTPKCSYYCDPITSNKISMNAHCEYQGKTIPCQGLIPPRTRVTLSCKIGYGKPDRSLPNIILCGESGEWNTHPWKCNQNCGIPTPELNSYIENGIDTEIRKVPWHVAVYSHVGEEYKYLCSGSIISSRIVLSAANCFWDNDNSQIGDASNYTIAAGKSLNARNAVEETIPQFFNISEIITKEQYLHDEGLYYNDIAVIILSEYIIFKEYILPVCVDFHLRDVAYEASGMLGKLSGWYLNESDGSTSEVLRTVELPSVDYTTCIAYSNVSFRKYITSDKFCAGLLGGTSVCQVDSGGGLVFNKPENGIDIYYIYGILSLGPSNLGGCDNTKYRLFTNLNYHLNLIEFYMNQYLNNVNETTFTRPQDTSCFTPVFPENGTIMYAHGNNGNCEGNCTKFVQFQCDSGECLPIENLCDGKIDCPDESDETIKRCASFYCPTFAFKCDYGACVSGEAKCDKNKDCLDASDESQELCNYPTPITFTSTQQPTIVTTKQPVSTTPPSDGSCYIPVIPKNGRIVYAHDNNIQLRAGEMIMLGSAIEYKCYNKYVLTGESGDSCFDGQWSYPTPMCRSENCTVLATRQEGTCKLLRQCPDVIGKFRQQRPTVCGYQGFQTIVCCPNPPQAPPTIQIPIHLLNSKRNRKCNEYAKAVYEVSERIMLSNGTIHEVKIDRCGSIAITHISGGLPALPREFPHSAILGYTTINGSIFWGCGGSLVSPNYIVTAGHCLSSPAYGNVTHARLGDLNIALTNDDALPETILIAERIPNPNYTRLSQYNDIALLRLERSVTLNPYIRPICLPLEKATTNTKAIATGWGRVNSSNLEGSSSLLKVTLDLFSHAECNENYQYYINRMLKDGIVDDTQVCAGSKSTDRKNTCGGDTGSPLQMYNPSTYCTYILYGVTSFGKGCGLTNSPGVFTRVSAYIDWIESVVWPNES